jgi:hypothetical protein
VEAPYRGYQQALQRARVPYVPVHIDRVADQGTGLKVLILPNIGAMSDQQAAGIRAFVQRGGAVIATGVTSLYDENGDARADFALADLFGAHAMGKPGAERKAAGRSIHTYLRLTPELRGGVWGPKAGDEPAAGGQRHAVLQGFGETDIVLFGGMLVPLKLDAGVQVPLTFVPEFPIYPPETSWMRQPKTDIPGLVLNGRVAYLAADLDRRYQQDGLPDHGDLLGNLVRWAAQDSVPIRVEGKGSLDCNLYSQSGRLILHIVNLTGIGRTPIEDSVGVGPLRVGVKLPDHARVKTVRMLVAGSSKTPTIDKGWARVAVARLLDHEVLVFE